MRPASRLAFAIIPAFAIAACVAFEGCFYEWGSVGDISDGAPPSDVASEASPPLPPTPPPQADGGADASCTASKECPDGYCEYADDYCGQKLGGTCKPIPSSCRTGLFCGCDNHVYGSDCEAATKGTDVTAEKSLCPDGGANTARCGEQFCKDLYFCVTYKASHQPSECIDPTGCSPTDCGCVKLEKYLKSLGCSCTAPAGHAEVVCP